jgi:ParB family chromosome partitioning protein
LPAIVEISRKDGDASMDKQKRQDQLLEVPLCEIVVNPKQPRTEFQEIEIQELADSIQAVGLIHPPVVRDLGKNGFELVAGERRLRACQALGLSKIRVIVRETSRQKSAEAALVENIQRVDLNPIEVAMALKTLSEEHGYGQEELGRHIGKKRSTIANYLRLLFLPDPIQLSLQKRFISMGHAKVILAIKCPKRQLILHERILADELTVRQAEAVMKVMTGEPKASGERQGTRDFYLEDLELKLQRALGTKVTLRGSGTKGRMVIDYHTLDDLHHLLEHLGVHSNGA